MNIVYNSQHYHLVEYPSLDAYELIDKTLGVAGYLEGEVAQSFRVSLQRLIAEDPSGSADAARLSISSAARRVKVRRRMRSGWTPCEIRYDTRYASVLVFPLPAPATINKGPSRVRTASS